MTEYEHIKTAEELVKYQIMMASEYPLHPVEMTDWNRLDPDIISVEGLKEIEIIRRKITMGKAKPWDIVIYLELLHLYAFSNPSNKRIRQWKKELNFHYNTILKTRYYPDLRNLGFTIFNKNYDEKLLFWHIKWGDDLIKECRRLAKLENEI